VVPLVAAAIILPGAAAFHSHVGLLHQRSPVKAACYHNQYARVLPEPGRPQVSMALASEERCSPYSHRTGTTAGAITLAAMTQVGLAGVVLLQLSLFSHVSAPLAVASSATLLAGQAALAILGAAPAILGFAGLGSGAVLVIWATGKALTRVALVLGAMLRHASTNAASAAHKVKSMAGVLSTRFALRVGHAQCAAKDCCSWVLSTARPRARIRSACVKVAGLVRRPAEHHAERAVSATVTATTSQVAALAPLAAPPSNTVAVASAQKLPIDDGGVAERARAIKRPRGGKESALEAVALVTVASVLVASEAIANGVGVLWEATKKERERAAVERVAAEVNVKRATTTDVVQSRVKMTAPSVDAPPNAAAVGTADGGAALASWIIVGVDSVATTLGRGSSPSASRPSALPSPQTPSLLTSLEPPVSQSTPPPSKPVRVLTIVAVLVGLCLW